MVVKFYGSDWFGVFIDSSAPAWIQAIGSVVAIFAATLIARQQTISSKRLEEFKEAKSDIRKFNLIMALMVRANWLSADICKAFESASFEDFDQVSPDLMLDTHNSLKALPIFEVPDGLLALDILTIGRALSDMREYWLQIRLDCETNPEFLHDGIARLDSFAREIGEVSVAAIDECKKAISERQNCLVTFR